MIAHENVPRRFDRYVLTAGYNAVINQRQFQVEGLQWPTDYRYPDETYSDTHSFEVGGERFELHHAKGETDDHTWTWVPSRRVLCCGDLFIWATPNAGNPQKVQRYPRDWAAALRAMAQLDAEMMLPGHGLPVMGAERVKAAFEDTAALLESICDQTFELMNSGASLDEVIHGVTAPPELRRQAVPASRSTTSRSSSSATCGGSTAAGTTAIPRTSSPRPRRSWPPSWRGSSAARGGSRTARSSWRTTVSCAWPATWPSSRCRPIRSPKPCAKRAR